MDKLTLEQFGQQIKSKYAQYSSFSNIDVANKVLAKYPQYQSKIRVQDTYTAPIDAVTGFASRAGNDITTAGKNVENAISGTGSFEGQGTLRRATGAVSELAGAPLKVASEALPEFARTGISKVGEGVGGIISWLGEKLGSTQLAQDFVMKHPDAAKSLEEIAGTAANAGNIAGNIAGAEGIAKGAPAVADTTAKIASRTGTIADTALEGTKGYVANKVETSLKKDWTNPVTANKPAYNKATQIYKNAESQGHDISTTLVKNKLNLADHVESGSYNTLDSAEQIRTDAAKASREMLRPALKQADYSVPHTSVDEVVSSAKSKISSDKFLTQEQRDALITKLDTSQEALAKQYPQGMSLTDMLDEKITRDYNSKYNPLGDIASNAEATKNKALADVLRGKLDEKAPEGVPVKEFNAELAKQYQAADYLQALNGKRVPQSLLSKIRNTTAKVVGAGVGHGLGGGLLGGVGGYHIGGMIESILEGIPSPLKSSFIKNLERENPEAFKAMTDYLNAQGRMPEIIPKLPPGSPVGSPNNPIITPEPKQLPSTVTSVEAKRISIKSPKTGKYERAYTSEPRK